MSQSNPSRRPQRAVIKALRGKKNSNTKPFEPGR